MGIEELEKEGGPESELAGDLKLLSGQIDRSIDRYAK
jgi:hypothetical protein